MKGFILVLFLTFSASVSFSQASDSSESDTITYRITTSDGGEIIGKILTQDEREIYVLTREGKKVYIPQYVIKEMVPLKSSDFNAQGYFVGEDAFATRYFITTNGLAMKKGDHYVKWGLLGPDFNFAVGENLSVGLTTTWVGIPIIGTIKKSWQLNNKMQVAVGALVGSGSWALPSFAGALPFGTVSFGNRSRNIAFSAGYGVGFGDGQSEGRAMTSVAGMIKISNKLSLVFDSFILLSGQPVTETNTFEIREFNPTTNRVESRFVTETYTETRPGFALIIPGLRWHQSTGKAFQFGFTVLAADGEAAPVPIPTIQWYRKL